MAEPSDALGLVKCRKRDVLDHGCVELLDVMPRLIPPGRLGIEHRIADAARVSYGEGTRRVSDDRALLRYLLRHRHTTPFEQVRLHFRVAAPLFVARQWFRHRTGSFNEVSARYSVLPDRVYVPSPLEMTAQAAGAHANRQSGGDVLPAEKAAALADAIRKSGAAAYELYETLLKAGVSREIARTVLPVGVYTEFVWTVDLWNLMHFLRLRMDPHAQAQMRAYANAIYSLLTELAPTAVDAFDDYIREAVTLTRIEADAVAREFAGKHVDCPAGGEASGREKAEWAEKKARLFAGGPPR